MGGIFDIQLTGVVVEAHPPSPCLPGVVVLYMYSIVEPAEAYSYCANQKSCKRRLRRGSDLMSASGRAKEPKQKLFGGYPYLLACWILVGN